MRNAELAKQESAIRRLIRDTSAATGGDLELQSHWAKYLCVLVAGYVENCLQVLYGSYVNKCAPAPVARFAVKKLKALQNPQAQRFIEVANGFKEIWGAELQKFVQTDGRDEAIKTIMLARHSIAHGKNSDVSVHRVLEYFDKCVEVAEFVEGQLLS
jgi:hypothetical protein